MTSSARTTVVKQLRDALLYRCLVVFIVARNSNLQVVITHALHVCSQHSFGLPLRINGMHTTQFDHLRLNLLSLAI